MWKTTRTLIIALGLSFVLLACIFVGGLYLWARQEGLPPWKAIQLRITLAFNDDDLHSPVDPGDPRFYEFEITGAEGSAGSIAAKLQREGLIRDAALFQDYVEYHGLDTQLQVGTYYLQRSQDIPAIAHVLIDASSAVIRFRIEPGWRLEQIAEAINANPQLDFTGGDFLALVGPGATIPPELDAARLGIPAALYEGGPSPSLEGVMFPGDYALRPGITVVEFRDELIEAFNANVTDPMIQQATSQGLTMYEVLTLASIVQRETWQPAEGPTIASVYLNRLAQNMRLDADPTVQYAIGQRDGRWWPLLQGENDYYARSGQQPNYRYNTYLKQDGAPTDDLLPPGPIASPGLGAINAVLNPDQTPFFYFFSCDGQTHTFSADLAEHNRQIEACQGQ
jgi:UPF0755 protein